MKNVIFGTDRNLTGFISRVSLGIIMFPHGAQKALGWFGGYGFTNTLDAFTTYFHLPVLLTVMVILIEFVGSLALIAGFASRIWSVAMIVLVLGMITKASWQHGFFMNWTGQQAGEGFEYHLLLLALSFITLVAGSGAWSVDYFLAKRKTVSISGSCGM